MKLPSLIPAVQKSWNKDTSYYPDYCECKHSSHGQCAVTALVVQDYFGGDIIGCFVNDKRHYFNRLDNRNIKMDIDLTAGQFGDKPEYKRVYLAERVQLLSNKSTRLRYEILKERVKRNLGEA